LIDEKEEVAGITTAEQGLIFKEMPCPLADCASCKDRVGSTLADEFALNRIEVNTLAS
jgi:hypothetical protein